MRDGDWGQIAFENDEIITKLNQVYPHDWARLIDQRINTPGQPAPLKGIELGGYKLVWKEEPNPFFKGAMADAKALNLTHSIGLTLDKDAKVTATLWDGPAFKAGIVSGSTVLAVNGIGYTPDELKSAITAAKTGAPLELLTKRGDRFITYKLDYKGGLRWPWLERAAPGTAPTGLDLLLVPKRPLPKATAKPKGR